MFKFLIRTIPLKKINLVVIAAVYFFDVSLYAAGVSFPSGCPDGYYRQTARGGSSCVKLPSDPAPYGIPTQASSQVSSGAAKPAPQVTTQTVVNSNKARPQSAGTPKQPTGNQTSSETAWCRPDSDGGGCATSSDYENTFGAPKDTNSSGSDSGSNPAGAAAGAAPAAADAAGSAASKATEAKGDEFTVKFLGGNIFEFAKTRTQFQEYQKKSQTHTDLTCSKGSLDTASTAGVVMNAANNASSSQGEAAQTGSTTSMAGTALFNTECSAENEALLAEGKAVETTLMNERTTCIGKAREDAIEACDSKCTMSGPAFGACHSACMPGVEQPNSQMCYKVALKIKEKDNAIMAFLKDHWGKMLLLLGALGAGLMALNSSGGKQKDDFQTNANKTATPTPTPTATGNPVVDNTQDQNNQNNSNNNNNGNNNQTPAYCKSSMQPLECYVTPACDIKCVAEKYGVSNYGGMDKDTRRINGNGQAVDSTAGGGGANASNSSLGSGSNSSGGSSGGAALSANGETGSSNNATGNVSTRGMYGGGEDGGFGAGGGYGNGGSSGSNGKDDRYNGQAQVARGLAAANSPEAKGPILPVTADLFQRISNFARTQCVRDLVKCEAK